MGGGSSKQQEVKADSNAFKQQNSQGSVPKTQAERNLEARKLENKNQLELAKAQREALLRKEAEIQEKLEADKLRKIQ